jgi:hypothetical protein
MQVTLVLVALQRVTAGGSYCWPRNGNEGNRPSDGPHWYVILYHVTGPGRTSATRPPALLELSRTWYGPEQTFAAC